MAAIKDVAKLAGVPNEVVKRAREILTDIESNSSISLGKGAVKRTNTEPDLFSQYVATKDNEVADRLRDADLNTITPIEAMNFLFELKKLLAD